MADSTMNIRTNIIYKTWAEHRIATLRAIPPSLSNRWQPATWQTPKGQPRKLLDTCYSKGCCDLQAVALASGVVLWCGIIATRRWGHSSFLSLTRWWWEVVTKLRSFPLIWSFALTYRSLGKNFQRPVFPVHCHDVQRITCSQLFYLLALWFSMWDLTRRSFEYLSSFYFHFIFLWVIFILISYFWNLYKGHVLYLKVTWINFLSPSNKTGQTQKRHSVLLYLRLQVHNHSGIIYFFGIISDPNPVYQRLLP